MADAAGSAAGDEADVDKLREQLAHTVSLLQLRNKQIERLNANQKRLQEELDDKTIELRQSTVTKSRRRAPQRQKQQAKIAELTRENERLRKQIDGDRLRAQGHLAALEVDLSTVQQELTSDKDDARRAYEREREQLRERTDQLHGELTRALEDNRRLEDAYQRAQGELDDARDTINSMDSALRTKEVQCDQARAAVEEKERLVSKAIAEQEEAERKLAEVIRPFEQAKADLTEAKNKADGLQAELSACQNELNFTLEQNAESSSKVANLQQQVQATREELEAAWKATTDAESRVAELAVQAAELEEHQAMAESLSHELERLTVELRAARERSDALTAELTVLKPELEQQQGRVTELEAQVASLQARLETVETNAARVAQQLADSQAKCASLTEAKRRLEAQVQQLTSEQAVSSTHAVVGGKITVLEQLDEFGRNWVPTVPDRPARVTHPRDVTADMIRELERCEAFEVVGDRAHDGDAPWHSGLLMPANRLRRSQRRLQGANSVVFKIRVQGALFALKGILPLGQVSRNPGAASAQKLERNASEYKAQIMLCHPSIARVRHAFDGPADLVLPWIPEDFFVEGVIPWRKTTYIVTDYLHTFEQWLQKHERRQPKAPFGLKERTMQIIMLQLCSAVQHMVDNNIAHNDLKLDNLFLQENGRVIIGDFGEATFLVETDGSPIPVRAGRVITGGGNMMCRAPEILQYNSGHSIGGNPMPSDLAACYAKADLWSIGRLGYQLLNGPSAHVAFPDNATIFLDEDLPALPSCYSVTFGAVLKLLVRADPARRPSPKEAVGLLSMLLFYPLDGSVSVESVYDAALWLRSARNKCLQQRLPAGVDTAGTTIVSAGGSGAGGSGVGAGAGAGAGAGGEVSIVAAGGADESKTAGTDASSSADGGDAPLAPAWDKVEKELLYEFVYGTTPAFLFHLVRMWNELVAPAYGDLLRVAFGEPAAARSTPSGGASSD